MHYSHHPDIGSFGFATNMSISPPYVSGPAPLSMYGDIRSMYVHIVWLSFKSRCGYVEGTLTVCSSVQS